MDLVGIDIDQLRAQRDTLLAQITGIETIIRIVSESKIPPPEVQRAPPVPVPVRVPESPARYTYTGARKAVVLALHTGPASIREIARALVWDQRKVREVLTSMHAEGIATESAGEVNALTEKGTTMARWFLDNPKYVVYCPNRKGTR
jgi:hypothetical protein